MVGNDQPEVESGSSRAWRRRVPPLQSGAVVDIDAAARAERYEAASEPPAREGAQVEPTAGNRSVDGGTAGARPARGAAPASASVAALGDADGARAPELISVLIGVYNGAPYLAEAIDSVFAQTYRPLELILVDDGSTDGSAEIARGYGDGLRYHYQENAGDGAARNAAVALARGELLAFMDADDRSTPERLELQQQALAADPTLDAVFGQVREFISPELSPAQRASIRPPSSEPAAWVSPTVMLIRREAFARVGLFSETLRLGSTVDWCARALDHGLRTTMLPEVVMERRLHATNLGRRNQDARSHYVEIVKSTLARRRLLGRDRSTQG